MSKTTKTIIALVILIIIVLVIYLGIGKKTTQAPMSTTPTEKPIKEETIKIGILAHQTGFGSIWGDGEIKAAVDSIKELQNKGAKIEYVVEDCASDKDKCVNAANKLINIDKVDVIIGPTWDEWFEVVAPIAQQNKVILISPSGAGNRLIGKYIFSLKYNNKGMASAILNFLDSNNIKNAAIVTAQDAYFMNILNAFKNLDTKSILRSELEVTPNEKDFKTIIAKIKNNDAVIVNVSEAQYPSFIKTLKEFGFKGMVVLTGAPHPEKEIYSGINYIDFNAPAEFMVKYNSPSSPMVYDAVRLYYEAYKNVGKDPDKIADYLEKINFNGVMGVIKFNEIHEADWDPEVYKIVKY
jgi:ABC-type branched-subunit amino acid transport system substrate-binding protein